jgi:asparagine synthase (glutamine-hydrolysing)
MCGIVGFWSGAVRPSVPEETVGAMADCLTHRGPDSRGVWCDDEAGVALGHRRLAVVDLSPSGAQPMTSSGGRWVIILNGEIYNYRTLRDELHALGCSFRGDSDTEVLLAAIEEWGAEAAIARSAGMFALALWDIRERRLYLTRDRLGEKPLYVASTAGGILFASELKAFQRHPAWEGRVSHAGLHEFLRYGYVPTSACVYEHVRKVVPGTIEVYQARSEAEITLSRVVTYWSARDVVTAGAGNRLSTPPSALVDDLDSVLRTVIGEQMVADVPLGAFLSGGIDSSLIVALMQRQGGSPVRTFSIGFDVPDYDEAPHAKAVAAHLGTNHTELYVTSREAMDVVERLPAIYDEPFADSSQIPTFLVAQMARRHVTVSLSGDGGDEVFGGYNRYAWTERAWRKMGVVPMALRRAAARTMQAGSPEFWDVVGAAVGRVAPSLRMRTYGDKVHKLSRLLQLTSRESMYEEMISSWSIPSRALHGRTHGETKAAGRAWPSENLNFVEQMMLADLTGYLRDDILVKVDRAAMAVSLETRAPFIDHRVVEFAARLPYDVKVRGGTTKWILRELLHRYVPAALVERPKMGFGVPLHVWLRGDLRDWAEALLEPGRLKNEGYFDPKAIHAVWGAHVSGRTNALPQIWPVLMFQAWYEAHVSASSGVAAALRA